MRPGPEFTVDLSEEEWRMLRTDLMFARFMAREARLERLEKGVKQRYEWLEEGFSSH